MFQGAGYKTYVAAANDTDCQDVAIPYCDEYIEIAFRRNPLHPGNFSAYFRLRKTIQENHFDIIHCHTPVGGLLGRLAAIGVRKHGTKVIYTAHGFHFYKGAPIKNWLFYYPVERFCSRFTDKLITINQEDYALAKNKFHAKEVHYVPGVGIDLSRFENVEVNRAVKRREIGVPEDAFLLLSVGELNENKNHQVIIKAIAKLNNPKVHYAIAGVGDKRDFLLDLAKQLGVSEQLHLLGYRRDIPELNHCADVFCLPSIREGLPVSVMEAMACGKPCVVSRIRGNTDLVDLNGGELFNPCELTECCSALWNTMKKDLTSLSQYNLVKIKSFSCEAILKLMKGIYAIN